MLILLFWKSPDFIHSFFHSFIHSFTHTRKLWPWLTTDSVCVLMTSQVPRLSSLSSWMITNKHMLSCSFSWTQIIHERPLFIPDQELNGSSERASEGSRSLVRKPALQERRGRGRGVYVGRACVLLLLRFDADFRVCDVMLISWSIYDF